MNDIYEGIKFGMILAIWYFIIKIAKELEGIAEILTACN